MIGEKEQYKNKRKDFLNFSELKNLSQNLELNAIFGHNSQIMIDSRCPALHKEIADAKTLPLECNLDLCLRKLEETYHSSKVHGFFLF